MHSFRLTNWSWWCLLRRVLQHWTGSAAGAGRPVVVEVVDAALLVGRWDSLLSPGLSTSFRVAARSGRCSGRRCGLRDELGAVAGRRCEPLRCIASYEL